MPIRSQVINIIHAEEKMLFSLAWKEFSRRKSRALLSMVGIIFSITLLVAVMSISKEVQEVARKPLESAGADM